MQSALLGQCFRRSVQSFYELIYTTKLSSVSPCVSETFVLLLLIQVTLNQLCNYYDFIIDKIVIGNTIADRWLLSDWFWCCSFTLFFFCFSIPYRKMGVTVGCKKVWTTWSYFLQGICSCSESCKFFLFNNFFIL